ncbi:hypothetical protein ABMA28_007735 [Loxostege sticticalis]|uniref:PKD/REJ-like domain-containing protein n=1 Tax=Loxostege sticticalis TaxID=481309 RepID=A0ABD0SIK3_LOXSC
MLSTFKWTCIYNDEDCNIAAISDTETFTFPSGLPDLGMYQITLSVSVLSHTSSANATIMTVSPILPVLQINPSERLLNEGSTVEIVANASNVVPSCTLSWYFASEDYLAEFDAAMNETCDDCQHGEALTDTLTIYSLEEQFLSELADYSNETEWRQVTTTLPARSGRARFVAQCGCSLTFSCDTEGTVYGDVWFQLNESPKAGDVKISPESGTAMETVFRISTRSVNDPDVPLEYSFYCKIGEDTLLLASYIEHRAVETLLPYLEGGTEVWVRVCDALGACSEGSPTTVVLSAGTARTVDALIEDVQAHVRRCELIPLTRIAQSAIVTYTHARQSAAATKFSQALQKHLATIDERNCIVKHYSQYSALLSWLAKNGIEISELLSEA